jgi:hypothetical protein
MRKWAENHPWWVKWAYMAGVGLMSAFASTIMPQNLQWIGFFGGASLVGMACFGSAWHGLNIFRESQGKPRLTLEPSHLIIAGLFIAVVGMGWQLYRSPKIVTAAAYTQGELNKAVDDAKAASQAELDDLKQKLADALKNANGGSSGFAPVEVKIPSKNYSAAEKRALLDLIGTISVLLNDKGLLAARIAHNSAISPSKDGLTDAMTRTGSVLDLLTAIQREIWNNILPNNINFATDLRYIIDNNAKFDQMMRATDRFLGQLTNFDRNLDSFNQDQRNWIGSLIEQGGGQEWARSADDFEGWIRQCNNRLDAERDGLK